MHLTHIHFANLITSFDIQVCKHLHVMQQQHNPSEEDYNLSEHPICTHVQSPGHHLILPSDILL